MSHKIQAGETQVAWALLTEGVSQARLEAHRLRHQLTRVQRLVNKSKAKEHIYQVAGDLVLSIPQRLQALERVLDRTSYALSILGAEHLRDRLPMSDRALVDDSTHESKPFGGVKPRSSVVAARYLRQADLSPPLGSPGGVCHLLYRVDKEVRNPRIRQELMSDIEVGMKVRNQDAAKIYTLEMEAGPGGKWKSLQITPHAQYRMDQRGVTVDDVRVGLAGFLKVWSDDRSRKGFMAKRWEEDMARGEPITWTSPKKLFMVFTVVRPDTVRLITTYWDGRSDPKPVDREKCLL